MCLGECKGPFKSTRDKNRSSMKSGFPSTLACSAAMTPAPAWARKDGLSGSFFQHRHLVVPVPVPEIPASRPSPGHAREPKLPGWAPASGRRLIKGASRWSREPDPLGQPEGHGVGPMQVFEGQHDRGQGREPSEDDFSCR